MDPEDYSRLGNCFDSRYLDPSEVPGHLALVEGIWLGTVARGGKVVEVGTYRGRSTCFMAREARQVITCDNFKGQGVLRPDQRPVDFSIVRRNWTENTTACGVKDRIVLIETSSIEAYAVIEKILETPFDLAFIDGSHREENLFCDVRFANFIGIGGIIAFHDYWDARYPDVRNVVDRFIFSFQNVFEEISSPGTIRAFRKQQDVRIPAEWFVSVR